MVLARDHSSSPRLVQLQDVGGRASVRRARPSSLLSDEENLVLQPCKRQLAVVLDDVVIGFHRFDDLRPPLVVDFNRDPVHRLEARQDHLQQLSHQTMAPVEREGLHLEPVKIGGDLRHARSERAVEQAFNRYIPNG